MDAPDTPFILSGIVGGYARAAIFAPITSFMWFIGDNVRMKGIIVRFGMSPLEGRFFEMNGVDERTS